MSDGKHEVLTYELFGAAVRELAQSIADDGFRPDVVLAVARGGLAWGMGLAYALDVKQLAIVNVELYTGVGARLESPILDATSSALDEVRGKTVLVADDVADSGLTLRAVLGWCAGHVAESRTAVVFRKPTSTTEPDYAWRATGAPWIDFPWSCQGPVSRSAMMSG